MIASLFYRWERRLASVTTDRVVRPFDWGTEWLPLNGHSEAIDPAVHVRDWVSRVMADTDGFYTAPPTDDYTFVQNSDGGMLRFPSAYETPHARNNIVSCRYFPARRKGSRSNPSRSKAAVLVLPQWNADAGGHIGLCRLLAWNGVSALRLSLPYHDERMPPDLQRADYIVSSNVARTVQVCCQAVLDSRRAIA